MRENIRRILVIVGMTMTLVVEGWGENLKLFYTSEMLRQQNGWLNSQNGAGLITYDEADFTEAFIVTSLTDRGLRDVYDPARTYTTALNIMSYQRLKRVMLYGCFVFNHDLKKNQNWNSMTHPGRSPLHIADKTPGNQSCESYYLEGGISIPLRYGFSLGGNCEFTGASNAKKKDIRNKNSFSFYHLSPAVIWQKGNVRVGANYKYGSETERIEWFTYGDKMAHEVFFFEGLWFGPSIITNSSVSERRFHRVLHQAAGQIEYITPVVKVFNEIKMANEELNVYLKAEEERGGQTKSVRYDWSGQLGIPVASFRHLLNWNVAHGFVKSYQNLQQRELIDFIYQYVQYGTILRHTQSDWNAHIAYKLRHMRENNDWNQSWSMGLDAGINYQDQRFRTYPAIFEQRIGQVFGILHFEKNFLFQQGMLDVKGSALWQTAWGTPIGAIDPQTTNGHKYQEDLQQAQYDYLTAPLAGGGIDLRYTWFQNPIIGIAPYVNVGCQYEKALAKVLKGKERFRIDMAFGLKF